MEHPKRTHRRRSGLRRSLAGLLASAFLLAGCAAGSDSSSDSPSDSSVVPSVPEREIAGAYLSLADYEQDPSVFAGDDVVFFFAASWCSTCRRTRANIESDLVGIPQGLVIVVVDYDAAGDLRRRYGVTVQHTFVQIDANGELLKKWSGSLTAEQIAEQTI